MNWSSLVTMSHAICRYVLTCGGVPRIIWEVHSGLIVRRVVLSVRGCLLWGISEWGCFVSRKICDFVIDEWWCFVSRKFVAFYFRSPGWVRWECGREECLQPTDGRQRMEQALTVWVNAVVSLDSARQILGGILTYWWINVCCSLIGNPELFVLVCGVADRQTNLWWCRGREGQGNDVHGQKREK